ncbi:MAG: hypothetical protein FJ404_03985 [Verrucomicrobia bacterium]|nr:hypothetical protein [Verrucomicrobiota bacterium]
MPGTPERNDQLTDDVLLQLDTDLLAIACERVKRAFLRELQLPDQWRGRVTLKIEPSWGEDRAIRLESARSQGGWRYQAALPPKVSSKVLVRYLAELLLQEFANRTSGDRQAEIPFWLSEGLSRHLLAGYKTDLLLRPQTRSVVSIAQGDPLEMVRTYFSTNRPLTINELSLPGQVELVAGGGLTYSLSAHLLYFELSRYHANRAPLVQYLSRSGHYLNWQSAFLESYRNVFPTMLDFEKWWAITVVNFTGRDPRRSWSFQESMKQLDDILKTPAQISIQPRAAAQHSTVSLQTMINQWDPAQQTFLFRKKISQLHLLKTRCAEEILPVVEDYRLTLDTYLARRQRAGYAPATKSQGLPSLVVLAQETVRRLDEVDGRKAALRPVAPAPSR